MPLLSHHSPFTIHLSPLFALTSSTWDNLSDGVAILIIAALLVVGLFLGYALRGLVGRWQAESIEKRMRLREEETESEIKAHDGKRRTSPRVRRW